MSNTILLGHGSGGKLSSDLIKKSFIEYFDNPVLNAMTDSAVININDKLLAFTTDSYVVDPVFFPGGDIGKLSVCGTINDLAVSGAEPVFISAGFIIEEGFLIDDLEKITASVIRYSLIQQVLAFLKKNLKIFQQERTYNPVIKLL
jgi:hydrogenase expression/formation protein HypE